MSFDIPYEQEMSGLAKQSRLNDKLKSHGWDHTVRVVNYVKKIGEALGLGPGDPSYDNAVIAAYWHDVAREQDSPQPYHAVKGAKIFQKNVLNGCDLDSIIYAIKIHADERAPNGGKPVITNYSIPSKVDKLVAIMLCDGDRLDLLRSPKIETVPLDILQTDYARKFANSDAHKRIYKS